MPAKIWGTRSGMTVVELTVVLLIMSLLAALAVPGFKKIYAVYSLQAAARRIQQDIRTLGQEALAREQPGYKIVFFVYNDSYTVYGPGKPRTVALPPGVDMVYTNFDNKSAGISDQLNFSARGKPTCGGHITLQSRLTEELTHVIVASVTGRTRIGELLPPG